MGEGEPVTELAYCTEPVTLSERTASGRRVRPKILQAFTEQNAAFQAAEGELQETISTAMRVTKTSEPPPSLQVVRETPIRAAFDSVSDAQGPS